MNLIKNKISSSTQKKLNSLFKKNSKKRPFIKNAIFGKKNHAGKNNTGKITVHHKGSGHKKKYRKIDFVREHNSEGIVMSLEYDPYRTALIASVYDFFNFNYFYILAPKHLNVGDIVKSGLNAEIKVGHSVPLKRVPIGSFVHNISLKKNKRAQLSRSAGTSSQLIENGSNFCKLILSSGKQKTLLSTCCATIGSVSNEFSSLMRIGKAGRNR